MLDQNFFVLNSLGGLSTWGNILVGKDFIEVASTISQRTRQNIYYAKIASLGRNGLFCVRWRPTI